MTFVTVSTEVDVDLDEFSDEELLDELESRNLSATVYKELITDIFHKRRVGQDYQKDLDELIYQTIGRIC